MASTATNQFQSSLLDLNRSKSIKRITRNHHQRVQCSSISSHSVLDLPIHSYYPSPLIKEPTIKIAKPTEPDTPKTAAAPKPKWNIFQQAAATALDAVEDAISNVLEKHHLLPKTADPEVKIAENFAPVGEQHPHHHLSVSGRIPPFINGVYVRR